MSNLSEFMHFVGVFEPLKDAGYFKQVRVDPELGTIVWPNGADVCPDVLYQHSRPYAPDDEVTSAKGATP